MGGLPPGSAGQTRTRTHGWLLPALVRKEGGVSLPRWWPGSQRILAGSPPPPREGGGRCEPAVAAVAADPGAHRSRGPEGQDPRVGGQALGRAPWAAILTVCVGREQGGGRLSGALAGHRPGHGDPTCWGSSDPGLLPRAPPPTAGAWGPASRVDARGTATQPLPASCWRETTHTPWPLRLWRRVVFRFWKQSWTHAPPRSTTGGHEHRPLARAGAPVSPLQAVLCPDGGGGGRSVPVAVFFLVRSGVTWGGLGPAPACRPALLLLVRCSLTQHKPHPTPFLEDKGIWPDSSLHFKYRMAAYI